MCLALLEGTIYAASSFSESGHINSGTITINLLYGRVQKSILNGDTWLGGAGYRWVGIGVRGDYFGGNGGGTGAEHAG